MFAQALSDGAPGTGHHDGRVGAKGTLAVAFASLAEIEFRMGHWQAAYASAVESLRLAHASGRGEETMHGLARLSLVEAGFGRAEACRRHGEQALTLAARLADDSCVAFTEAALGLLELGLGRLDAAVAWLERLAISATAVGTWASDLVEALIRRDDHDRAADAVGALTSAAVHTGNYATLRTLERCSGLLATNDSFEVHFTRALACPLHLDEPFERARTELCFGQRLRRIGQRVAAREHLHAALETFEGLGALPWVETTRRELRASGAGARRRVDETRDELTPQELQVAQIVADGATNREAADRLFVTTKTIETHLGRIYRKFGVRSRTELARRLHAIAA